MSSDEVEEQIKDIVCEQLGVEENRITDDTDFVNDLGADSLDKVELVMEMEDAFDLSIPDEEAERIQTVGSAIEYVVENTS